MSEELYVFLKMPPAPVVNGPLQCSQVPLTLTLDVDRGARQMVGSHSPDLDLPSARVGDERETEGLE